MLSELLRKLAQPECFLCNFRRSVVKYNQTDRSGFIDLRGNRIKYDRKEKELLYTPPSKALAHFDKIYSNVFGSSNWQSIRIALKCPVKKMVLLNNLSVSRESAREHIIQQGAVDIIPIIANNLEKYYSKERIEPAVEPTSSTEESSSQAGDLKHFMLPTNSMTSTNNVGEFNRRNMSEFVPATEVISEHEMYSKYSKDSLEVTTVRSETLLQGLSWVLDDRICVPQSLEVFAYPRSVVREPGQKDGIMQSDMYVFNGSNLLPVLALNLKPTDNVLQFGGYPGDTTLLILKCGLLGSLLSIERSDTKASMMNWAIKPYLSGTKDILEILTMEPRKVNPDGFGQYNKVILCPLCINDRLAANEDSHDNLFSRGKFIKRLNMPASQKSQLKKAILACEPGGDIVYMTNTLSPNQNADVVCGAIEELKSFNIEVAVVNLDSLVQAVNNDWFCISSEKDDPGVTILPYLPNNYGPSYLCKLRRLN